MLLRGGAALCEGGHLSTVVPCCHVCDGPASAGGLELPWCSRVLVVDRLGSVGVDQGPKDSQAVAASKTSTGFPLCLPFASFVFCFLKVAYALKP